jgi:hypothetical protein
VVRGEGSEERGQRVDADALMDNRPRGARCRKHGCPQGLDCRAAGGGESASAVLFGAPVHSTHTPAGLKSFILFKEEERRRGREGRVRMSIDHVVNINSLVLPVW